MSDESEIKDKPRSVPSQVFSPLAFKGRRFLVTGGSRGIGEATVRMLLELGASVAALARDPHRLKALSDELAGTADLLTLQADVSDPDALSDAVDRCHRRWGELHGLVNNAMLSVSGTVLDLSEERFRASWEINALAAWRLVRLCIPLMEKAGGGSIVNVSSVMAHHTQAGNHAYASSKGALEALTRNLAVELSPARVRVNTVIPGYIRTYEGHPGRDTPPDQWTPSMRLQAEYIEKLTECGQPWPEHGRPEDCAASIVFLLSDAATFITGASLAVDGGLLVDFRSLDNPRRLAHAKELAELEHRIEALRTTPLPPAGHQQR